MALHPHCATVQGWQLPRLKAAMALTIRNHVRFRNVPMSCRYAKARDHRVGWMWGRARQARDPGGDPAATPVGAPSDDPCPDSRQDLTIPSRTIMATLELRRSYRQSRQGSGTRVVLGRSRDIAACYDAVIAPPTAAAHDRSQSQRRRALDPRLRRDSRSLRLRRDRIVGNYPFAFHPQPADQPSRK